MAQQEYTTVRSRKLGAMLRRFREERGLTLDEAGKHLERSRSSLSKIENAQSLIRPRDLRQILDGYQITEEPLREALIDLSRHSHEKGWWQSYASLAPPAYLDLLSLEQDARSIRTYEPVLVPGLLQTEDYVRALLEVSHIPVPEEDTARFVEERVERQARLSGEEPLELWAVLEETVIHRIAASNSLRGQLKHLASVGKLPNVTIQVLPTAAGVTSWVSSKFDILEFPQLTALDVVYLENLAGNAYLEDVSEVRRYILEFDHLRAAALSPSKSRRLIAEVAAEST